jgi:hypothetical protein
VNTTEQPMPFVDGCHSVTRVLHSEHVFARDRAPRRATFLAASLKDRVALEVTFNRHVG